MDFLFHVQQWQLWIKLITLLLMLQKLAMSISPECEHRAIKDGGRVRRFEVSLCSFIAVWQWEHIAESHCYVFTYIARIHTSNVIFVFYLHFLYIPMYILILVYCLHQWLGFVSLCLTLYNPVN